MAGQEPTAAVGFQGCTTCQRKVKRDTPPLTALQSDDGLDPLHRPPTAFREERAGLLQTGRDVLRGQRLAAGREVHLSFGDTPSSTSPNGCPCRSCRSGAWWSDGPCTSLVPFGNYFLSKALLFPWKGLLADGSYFVSSVYAYTIQRYE